MMLTDDSYTTYQILIERVAAFARTVRQRYAEHINCKAGCDSCCYQTFTIFPVEAAHMALAIAGLSPAERCRLQAHLDDAPDAFKMAAAAQPCVLLVEGRCLLYEGRPLLCRMHGYPMYSAMLQHTDGSRRDCCPLNFSALPLPLLETESIFNLDLVNQTLAAINHRFVQEHELTDERLSIKHVVTRTLSE